MEPWQHLAEFVGWKKNTTAGAEDLEAFLKTCWAEALVLVDDFIGTKPVPPETYTLAVKRTGAALFQARKAQNKQSEGYATEPVRLAKDPLTTAYPLLQPHVGWF